MGSLPPGNGYAGSTIPSFTPAAIVINGGALQTTATMQISAFRGIAVGSPNGGGGGRISVASGTTLTYGFDAAASSTLAATVTGIISDTNMGGSLTMTGGGTLLLTGFASTTGSFSANTYTGATNVNGSGGTLTLGVAYAVSRYSSLSVASGASVVLDGFTQNFGSLAGAGA